MRERRDLERLAGKALLDKEFRGRLLSRPHEVAQEEGVSLSEDEVKALHGLDPSRVEAWVTSLESILQEPMPEPSPGWLIPKPPMGKEPIIKGK